MATLQKLAALAAVLALCTAARCSANDGWITGRATFYDDNPSMTVDTGSCMFGYIDNQRFPGYHVAAISDSNADYAGSCGRCYEVSCADMDFHDNYGEHLSRSSACYDSSASVIVTITDTCPCYYPNNYVSNKRWCCGDMNHFDLSIWAFEKLANTKLGVIGVKYRQVPCGTQPTKAATVPAGHSPTPRRGASTPQLPGNFAANGGGASSTSSSTASSSSNGGGSASSSSSSTSSSSSSGGGGGSSSSSSSSSSSNGGGSSSSGSSSSSSSGTSSPSSSNRSPSPSPSPSPSNSGSAAAQFGRR